MKRIRKNNDRWLRMSLRELLVAVAGRPGNMSATLRKAMNSGRENKPGDEGYISHRERKRRTKHKGAVARMQRREAGR